MDSAAESSAAEDEVGSAGDTTEGATEDGDPVTVYTTLDYTEARVQKDSGGYIETQKYKESIDTEDNPFLVRFPSHHLTTTGLLLLHCSLLFSGWNEALHERECETPEPCMHERECLFDR